MDNHKYCYNSPWCEPEELCRCKEYDQFEQEQKNGTPDQVYVKLGQGVIGFVFLALAISHYIA